MMLVKAKHNIDNGGKCITGGTVFEITDAEFDALHEAVTPVGYVSEVFPPEKPEKKSATTRKRRTAKKE